MNTITVYHAMAKRAAGIQPASPEGGLFKRPSIPDVLGKPITAPGSQPIGDNSGPGPVQSPAQAPQQGVDAKMLEKGWEKTMEAMQNITAMNNGLPPQNGQAAATEAALGGQPGPDQGQAMQPSIDPVSQITGAPMIPKSASLSLVYKNMMEKKALFDGPDWQNWMMRKDVIDPANAQHLRSQDSGATTSFLTSLALGGGLGYLGDKLTGGEHTGKAVLGGGAAMGGLAMLANLIGKGAGYVTPTRTKAQHDKYQRGGTAAEWLIPGVANYNKVKTYGYALHGQEATREDDKDKKRKQQKG